MEDFRIDFEDGYGHRPDEEEDGHARSAAEELAAGMAAGTLPLSQGSGSNRSRASCIGARCAPLIFSSPPPWRRGGLLPPVSW